MPTNKFTVGDRFGRLTVLGPHQYRNLPSGRRRVIPCLCDCGQTALVHSTLLKTGKTTSCGCYLAESVGNRSRIHGLSKTPLYHVWRNMIARCYKPSSSQYHNYGERGIRVCKSWYRDFTKFNNWAMSNGYAYGLQIDRIDNNGSYKPSNCRWATPSQNQRNRRNNRLITAFGETKPMMAWLEDQRCQAGSRMNIRDRLGYGWSPEEAISIPNRGGPNKRLNASQ